MNRTRTILLTCWFCAVSRAALGQFQPEWEIESLTGEGGVVYDFRTGLATATNGVRVRYEKAVLTADTVSVDQASGEVMAEGNVRLQRDDQIWASDQVSYNFKTQKFEAQRFRTGRAPVF